MSARTKTWHIGEACLHGTIRVVQMDISSGIYLRVEVMDYKSKKVRERQVFHFVDKYKLIEYLQEFTTGYHVDRIVNHFYC